MCELWNNSMFSIPMGEMVKIWELFFLNCFNEFFKVCIVCVWNTQNKLYTVAQNIPQIIICYVKYICFCLYVCVCMVFLLACLWNSDNVRLWCVYVCLWTSVIGCFVLLQTVFFEKLIAKLRKQNKDGTWKWDHRVSIYKCFVLRSKICDDLFRATAHGMYANTWMFHTTFF